MKGRFVIAGLVLILGLIAGFVQEYIKINVNYVLETGKQIPGFFTFDSITKKKWIEYKKAQLPSDFYHKPKTIELLYEMNETELNRAKWAITFVFLIVFLIINGLILRLITGEWQLVKWLVYLYLFFFILSLCIFALGKLVGDVPWYSISREIAGALQSLTPLIIILPAYWLSKKMGGKILNQ